MPSVTAVMVTGHNVARRPLAAYTIQQFTKQTYKDCELLVLNQGDTPLLATQMPRVREVMTGRGLTLGEFRNLGWQYAESDLLCPWDDDDIRHADFLTFMMLGYRKNTVVAQVHQLVVLVHTDETFVSSMFGGYVNSMLFPRDCAARYQPLARGEDSQLLVDLKRAYKTVALVNPPYYYVRLCHGRNVWGESHFRNLPRGRRKVTADDRDYLAEQLPPILKLLL